MVSREQIYNDFINHLKETYKDKNHDYGNSVGDTFEKFGDVSFLVRITDKFNRLNSLYQKGDAKVAESMDDTILDMANYCLLWLVEREYADEMKHIKGPTGAANSDKAIKSSVDLGDKILADIPNIVLAKELSIDPFVIALKNFRNNLEK